MIKRPRNNIQAYYYNYTDIGITREPILINDIVNILIRKNPIIWSTKVYSVVKIESPMYAFLRDKTDTKNEMVPNGHYRLPDDTTIYRAIKEIGTGWKAINIDTGNTAYLRPHIYEQSLERLIKMNVMNLKLKKSAVPPRVRMRLTDRFFSLFKF